MVKEVTAAMFMTDVTEVTVAMSISEVVKEVTVVMSMT